MEGPIPCITSGCLTVAFGPERRAGFYLSAASIILGSLTMSLIDLHKRSLLFGRGKSAKQRPSRLQSTRSNAFTLASNPPSNCMVDPASGASSSSGFHAVLAGPLCRSAPASLGHGDDYREVGASLIFNSLAEFLSKSVAGVQDNIASPTIESL